MTESEEESQEEDPWRRPFYLLAVVYSYQTRTVNVRISILPEDTAETVATELEETVFEGDEFHFLCAVQPQPLGRHIAMVTESTWTRLSGLVPVLIDPSFVGGVPFQIFVKRELRLSDIVAAMGDDWRTGFCVYADDADEALGASNLYMAHDGMLLAVCPADAERPQFQCLEDRLLRPQDWAVRCTEVNEPDEPLLLHHAVILGGEFRMPVIPLPYSASWAEIREAVASAVGTTTEQQRLTTTARHLQELEIRGRRLPNVVGVSSEGDALLYGLFIDARELGMSIAFVQRSGCTANIHDLLDAAGGIYVLGLEFLVEGALLYTPATGTVTYGHRSVLTVRVDVASLQRQLGNDITDAGDSDGGRDDPDDRSRSPRRSGPGDAAAGSAPPSSGGCGEAWSFPERAGDSAMLQTETADAASLCQGLQLTLKTG